MKRRGQHGAVGLAAQCKSGPWRPSLRRGRAFGSLTSWPARLDSEMAVEGVEAKAVVRMTDLPE